MLIYAILAVPAAAGAAAVIPWRRWISWLAAAANGTVLVMGAVLAAGTTRHHAAAAAGGVLRADALSAFMVVVIGAIALLASCQSARYLSAETARGACTARHAALYTALIQAFVSCMLVAVLAANLGVMWVAVEATTITTTFLVGHRQTSGALEASWKYMVICSAGIALAFLGTALVYYAGLHAAGHPAASLGWTSLMAAAPRLDPGVMRLAVALLVLGYGTKAGLVPMHSWLPDAHSQAPVSALMSGVLLTVAFYALLRFRVIAAASLGPAYPRALLATAGLASLAVAASLLLAQRDYKRMLAYHSVEHMGLIALGAAAGSPLAIAAVLLHILGHGLAKGVLFLASGEILLAEGTSDIAEVPALLSRRPVLGGIFGFGLVALLGLPPFSLFVSELNMVRAEVATGLGWAAAIALACMAVIFAAVLTHGRQLLLGGASPGTRPQATPRIVTVPLTAGLAACVLLGVSAWPLQPLLHAAAQVAAS
jgi:hydrogenase-4 component F